MAKDQIYSSVIRLNTEDAQNKMEDLKKRVQDLVALRDTIDKKKDSGYYKSVSKQITAAKAELKAYENEVMKTIQTLDNLGNASAKDIRDAQKALQKMIDAKPQGAEEMGEFVRRLQEVKQELQSIATMRAFDEVKAGIVGTGKSAQQLGAEMRFLRETSQNVGTASAQQLEKALEVAREHLKVAEQGSQAYERSSEYIRVFSAQLETIKEKQKQSNTLIDRYNKELKEANQESRSVRNETELIDRVLGNISGATLRDLEYSIKALNEQMKDMDRNTDTYKEAEKKVRTLRTELERTRQEASAQQSMFEKFISSLNKNWGAITQIIGAVTGLTMTMRKSVQDYATMEEEMANVRKYTGLATEGVVELNDELKKWDTRTKREDLNKLAGAAGRLGIQTKEGALEFADGANMIKVSLGDDLGEDAVDQIGKLAMAFGEDERMGLRGAMLATGSAVNELSQNSSAKAGFLVDYTARVAGFGKQLGLTQAQIMGYGAVMDENLLRDEMAATAFGNMLTKMQTDTEKFARIAGQSVEDFTKLLNEDANQAILNLADSLRSQDPQTMMKMLDDMGLDGARAVGVLSTLADKIDDVRDRQELATKAYKEATSITKEYDVMNNTVQARLEKCRNKFHEMTIELGGQLLPIVKYTCTGFSLMVKGLSELTSFIRGNWKAIILLSAEVALLTTVYKAAEIRAWAWAKIELLIQTYHKAGAVILKMRTAAVLAYNAGVALLTGNLTRATAAMRLMRMAALSNPYTALLTVILTLGTAIYGLVAHFRSASKEAQENAKAVRQLKEEHDALKAVSAEANTAVAEEMTKFKQLRKTLEDNKKGYAERKKALDEIKRICPEYHGQLTTENKLINSNVSALDDYTTNLMKAARAQAAFNKMVKLQESSMGHEETLQHRQGNRRYAQQQLNQLGASEGTTFKYADWNVGYAMYDEKGNFVKYIDAAQKKQIEHYQQLIQYNDERISQEQEILDRNKRQSEQMQEIVDEGKDATKKANPSPSPITKYESDAERKAREKKEREEERKRLRAEHDAEKERREQNKQLKAEMDNRLAEEAVSYSLGLTNYRDYIEKRKQIQLESIKERKALFEKGSTEYLRIDAQEKMLLAHGDEEARKLSLKEKEREHSQKMAMLEASFYDERFAAYHNEQALNEMLFQEEMAFLQWKKDQAVKGSLEEMQLEWEIADRSAQHQEETRRDIEERLLKIRTDYLHQSNDMQRDIELNALQELYDKKLLAEEDYQQARLAIEAKYAQNPAQATKDQFTENVNNGLAVAREKAGDANASNPWTGDLTNYLNINTLLKQLYEQDKLTHAEYLAAKAQNLSEFIEQVQQKYQVMYQSVSAVLGGISNYAKACSDYEVAVVEKNYDKQIEAAGKNERKRKKLEEQKQKEIAAIKSKANKKAMKIEIAQAIASTAMGAINAYSSAAQVPFIGYILAPIAAAAAVAAGMLQVATIKKQHQTEELGYYKGGFTGGNRYRKEAGIVHEGEFVANHQTVQNPNILPFLNFLDQAQRNNTVGSLTAEDVSRSMGAGGSSQIVTPIVNVQTDNEELRDAVDAHREATDRLLARLQYPIDAQVVLTGTEGLNAKQDLLNRMLKNK